jgi:hypothetical protein
MLFPKNFLQLSGYQSRRSDAGSARHLNADIRGKLNRHAELDPHPIPAGMDSGLHPKGALSLGSGAPG